MTLLEKIETHPQPEVFLELSGGNMDDAYRAHTNRCLTNKQIMIKVHDQIRLEQSSKSLEQSRKSIELSVYPAKRNELDWNKLLKTKLFNNPRS